MAVRLLLPALAVSALVIAVVALVKAGEAHSHDLHSATTRGRATDSVPAAARQPATFDTDFIGSYQSETDEEEVMVVLPLGNLLSVEVKLRHLSEEDISMHTEFNGILWQDEHTGYMMSVNTRLVLKKGAEKGAEQLIMSKQGNTAVWSRAALPTRVRQELIKNGELPDGMQNV